MNYYALCEGRHNMPSNCKGSIFSNTINPLDIDGLNKTALQFVETHCVDELHLYVTGLTVALVAVINACHEYGIALKLYHYDKTTGDYYLQEVL